MDLVSPETDPEEKSRDRIKAKRKRRNGLTVIKVL
jgi:hypothetical protein